MLRHHSISFAVFVAVLAIGLAMRSASGADAGRGAALYESRCATCHSEAVHMRAKRVATDFDDVRRWVVRWNGNLKLGWGDEELDDVAAYLNETYYHFACPAAVCQAVSLAPGTGARQHRRRGT